MPSNKIFPRHSGVQFLLAPFPTLAFDLQESFNEADALRMQQNARLSGVLGDGLFQRIVTIGNGMYTIVRSREVNVVRMKVLGESTELIK
jgi:hypothetical protein